MCRVLGGGVEANPRLIGKGRHLLGPHHRREGAKQAWQALGRHDRDTVHHDLAPGTWAPWTATIGTTAMPGSGRTTAAWSASNETACRVGARG
jgi:hypothetical protein